MRDHSGIKIRKSGIELMRCFCMAMIIGYHYAQHSTIQEFNILTDKLSTNHIFALMFGNWGGGLGVIGFIVITSYFLFDDRNMHADRILNLVFKTWIYCIIMAVVGFVFESFSIKELIQEILTPVYGQYWFITAYCIFSALAPFICFLLEKLSLRQLICLLIILSILVPFYDVIFDGNFGNVSLFIYVLAVVRWVRLSPKIAYKLREKGMLFFILITTGVICLSCGVTFIGTAKENQTILGATILLNSKNIVMVIDAVCMFYGFLNLDISSRFINKLGKTTLGVYIIHENILWWHGNDKLLWDKIFHADSFIGTKLFPAHMCGTIIAIFFIAALIDSILSNPIQAICNKVFSKLYIKIDDFYSCVS